MQFTVSFINFSEAQRANQMAGVITAVGGVIFFVTAISKIEEGTADMHRKIQLSNAQDIENQLIIAQFKLVVGDRTGDAGDKS